jgi:deoxyribonuclease-4
MKSKNLLIGAHVSIAGGFDQAIVRAEKIGATCMQIFTKSNRQWKAREITLEQAKKFILQQKQSPIKTVIVHVSYLINVGSSSKLIAEKSIHALAQELQRADMLHIPYTVMHPGTLYDKNDVDASLQHIAKNIDAALQQAKPKHTMLLLETMAGQGSVAGATLEQISGILKHLKNKKNVGVCVDTAHIFAAGYRLDTPELYKNFWQEFQKKIGMHKLKAMHINDSKTACNSRVDRHEHIGKGKIGLKAFQMIMQDSHLKNIAKILETPKKGADDFDDDIKNLQTLRDCAS